MEFENPKPIYRQIGEWMCEKILHGQWPEGERVPSVRELAMLMEVNPNTAIRAFEELQTDGILFNRRGVGYFVEQGALKKIRERRRAEFLESTLPSIAAQMDALGIDLDTLVSYCKKYLPKK